MAIHIGTTQNVYLITAVDRENNTLITYLIAASGGLQAAKRRFLACAREQGWKPFESVEAHSIPFVQPDGKPGTPITVARVALS